MDTIGATLVLARMLQEKGQEPNSLAEAAELFSEAQAAQKKAELEDGRRALQQQLQLQQRAEANEKKT